MIRILIVDDDSKKVEALMPIIYEMTEITEEDVDYVLDINTARKKLIVNQYDLLIIDIQLPNKLGTEIQVSGGRGLLKEIFEVGKINKPDHIIGITSSEETKRNNMDFFEEHLWCILECNPAYEKWKKQIKNKIKYLLINKIKKSNQVPSHTLDLAVITAVKREYDSVIRLSDDWKECRLPNDPTIYQMGSFRKDEKTIKVVLAQQHQMGMPAAAVLSMKLINSFRPKYLAMVGIAAGNRDRDVSLGDIIVASESWDYGSGKIREGNEDETQQLFQPEPHQLVLDIDLKEKFSKDYRYVLYDIKNMFEGNRPKEELSLHVGPVASGASVIQDKNVVKEYIDKYNRKLVAVEMETYGVFYAAHNCTEPKPKVFSIKSVCDFADAEKNDNYQAYSAFTSARFMHYFVLNELF